jgi:predicted transcriptional regulator
MRERPTQVTSVAFPPTLAKDLQALADKRDWSVSKTVREAVKMAIAAAAAELHDATAA